MHREVLNKVVWVELEVVLGWSSPGKLNKVIVSNAEGKNIMLFEFDSISQFVLQLFVSVSHIEDNDFHIHQFLPRLSLIILINKN